jgi:hypothetical protein
LDEEEEQEAKRYKRYQEAKKKGEKYQDSDDEEKDEKWGEEESEAADGFSEEHIKYLETLSEEQFLRYYKNYLEVKRKNEEEQRLSVEAGERVRYLYYWVESPCGRRREMMLRMCHFNMLLLFNRFQDTSLHIQLKESQPSQNVSTDPSQFALITFVCNGLDSYTSAIVLETERV